MKDPSLPLQAAIVAALSGSPGPGATVYDRIPQDSTGKVTAAFPYIHIGEDQVVSDADQCHDVSQCYATVHVWSRAVGKVEAKTIMAAVCELLDVHLDIAGFGCIASGVDDGPRHLTDRDGLTSHSVATFRYLVAAPAV